MNEQKCTIEDMTADATIHGNIIDIEGYGLTGQKYVAGEYREPILTDVYCGNCGDYIKFEITDGVDEAVKRHIQ